MWGRFPQEMFIQILNEIREVEGQIPIVWNPEIHGGIDWEKKKIEDELKAQAEEKIIKIVHKESAVTSFKNKLLDKIRPKKKSESKKSIEEEPKGYD